MLVAMSVLLLAACGVEAPEQETETREVVPGSSVATGSTRPQGLGSTNKVLLLASTVTSGESSAEALAAKGLGYTVEVATAADWSAKTSADFATYRAIILGDPTCTSYNTAPLAEAVKNRHVWGPVVDGNVIVVGTDPVWHGKGTVTRNVVRFASAQTGKTGMYISLSCYYHYAPANTRVPVLEPFGTFTVSSVGCYNDAHIVAQHTALSGLTDSLLSNWGCSVHEAFDGYPAANFTPLVIARDDPNQPRLPGSQDFADGSRGVPYVLVRGATPVNCGDGVVQYPEECDTGTNNGVPGTTCSSVCRLRWCGDGVVDVGEDCDLGASNGSSAACSASCKGTVVNRPPVAVCKDLSLLADATCGASASVNNGSYDPDGDLAGCTQTPVGSFGLGSTLVTLTCTDATGQKASCTSTVTVSDTVLPTITCPAGLSAECVAGGATVNVPLADASDACGVVVSGANGSLVFSRGTTPVTHEARDSSGNTARCTFDVTVADTQAPVVSLNGAAEVTLECRKPYVEAGVTASDACSGDLGGTVTVSGSVNTRVPGTYTLTYSVTDGAGLVGSATRTVTVVPDASGTCQPRGGKWLSTGSLALPRMLHTATLLDDGRVLVAGGFNVTSELYDPNTRTWSTTGNNLNTHRYHTATKLNDAEGRVLIAGGRGSYNHVTAELYSPALGAWTAAGSLNEHRYHHAALLLTDGKVLVAGGSPSESNGGALASAELYDPATNTWSFTGGLNVARRDHAMTLLPNGKVLVTGGLDAADGLLSSAELYDPATGTWTLAAGMSTARVSHTATSLGDGKVLVVGGLESDPVGAASAELYDPATGTWSTTGGMTSPRRWHTANLLRDGRVLVAGGYHDYTGIQFAAELYDPATGTWSTTEAMRTDRYKHASVLLGDTVLIMGGVSNNDNAAAEYFDPNAL
jgi:N-acetylneuraminic acid mutarotase